MKPKKASNSNIETHAITLIELKARDHATLASMAKRYGAGHLIDFLEGIVMKEQGPNIVRGSIAETCGNPKDEKDGFTNWPVEKIRPLIWKFDKRRRIPLKEVAQLLGMPIRKVRAYAMDGTIPGARQFGPRKEWSFDRDRLEVWWQEFNAPRALCKMNNPDPLFDVELWLRTFLFVG